MMDYVHCKQHEIKSESKRIRILSKEFDVFVGHKTGGSFTDEHLTMTMSRRSNQYESSFAKQPWLNTKRTLVTALIKTRHKPLHSMTIVYGCSVQNRIDQQRMFKNRSTLFDAFTCRHKTCDVLFKQNGYLSDFVMNLSR